MSRLFTVRWPILARLDALLLFPVGLLLAAGIATVQGFVEHTVAPALPSGLFRWGLSKETVYWGEMVVTGIVPYFLLLVLADRWLTVRKGYAFLSAVAVASYSAAALVYAPRLAALFPTHVAGEVSFMAAGRHAAFAACILALLLHIRPLWIGLRDQGEIAARLVDGRTRVSQDDHYRERSDFRGWRPQHELEGSGGVPKEGRGLRVIFGAAWVSIMVGLLVAYFHWGTWGSGGHEAGSSGMAPGVLTGPSSGQPIMHPSALPSISELQLPSPPGASPAASPGASSPAALSPAAFSPGAPPTSEPTIVTAQLPMVQRPTELPPGPDADNGTNGAVAMRGKDGGFTFDAVINGEHVSMLFDTGASVVALRAEEAERLGISLSNLTYSAKVKTANGITDVAPVIINSITIGNITQRRVVGYVAREGTLPRNLLGQTFMAGLAGYNVENNRLVLRGH